MKKKYKSLILLSLSLAASLGFYQAFAQNKAKPFNLWRIHLIQFYYVQVNNLRLRAKPDLKSKTLAKLKEGEKVKFLGKLSSNKTKAMLRGIHYNSFFVLIKTGSGKTGWVYLPALGKIKPKPFKGRKLSFLQLRKIADKLSFTLGDDLVRKGHKGTSIRYDNIIDIIPKNKKPYFTTIQLYPVIEGSGGLYKLYDTGLLIINYESPLYFFYIAPFKPRPNGITAYMSKKQVKKILKVKPWYETHNLLIYPMYYVKPDEPKNNFFIFLFNKYNKLYCIRAY